MIAVYMRVDVGRMPAIVVSPCRVCAERLDTFLDLEGFAHEVLEKRLPPVDATDAGAVPFAERALEAYRAWRRTAAKPGCDHLEVQRPPG